MGQGPEALRRKSSCCLYVGSSIWLTVKIGTFSGSNACLFLSPSFRFRHPTLPILFLSPLDHSIDVRHPGDSCMPMGMSFMRHTVFVTRRAGWSSLGQTLCSHVVWRVDLGDDQEQGAFSNLEGYRTNQRRSGEEIRSFVERDGVPTRTAY